MKKLLFGLMAIGLLFTSCKKDKVDADVNVSGISQEVIDQIAAFRLNTEGLTMEKLELPNGEFQDVYLAEGCIAIHPEQLAELKIFDGITSEQYRTYNLVNNNQTIDVIGYTGGSNALTSKMQTALQWAVDNYNRLNIGLNFNLTFGTNYSSKDIVVYKTSGAAGGVAGFPSGGAPYKWVQIFSGTDSYNTNVIEHVITHEMGHCLGMRHTDWATRASCGQSGESAGSDGAVHIPGTPTGYDSNSLMLACFGSGEDGEFGSYDIVALEYLY